MATWASETIKRLELLEQAMYTTVHNNADGIVVQLSELLDNRQSHGDDYQAALVQRGELAVDIATAKADLVELEAPVKLRIVMERDDKGKAVYGNDGARAAALTVAMSERADYKALVAHKREMEKQLARTKALVETLEAQTGEYNQATRNLTSRLNNLTARVK